MCLIKFFLLRPAEFLLFPFRFRSPASSPRASPRATHSLRGSPRSSWHGNQHGSPKGAHSPRESPRSRSPRGSSPRGSRPRGSPHGSPRGRSPGGKSPRSSPRGSLRGSPRGRSPPGRVSLDDLGIDDVRNRGSGDLRDLLQLQVRVFFALSRVGLACVVGRTLHVHETLFSIQSLELCDFLG